MLTVFSQTGQQPHDVASNLRPVWPLGPYTPAVQSSPGKLPANRSTFRKFKGEVSLDGQVALSDSLWLLLEKGQCHT